jgi:hypothetical protein
LVALQFTSAMNRGKLSALGIQLVCSVKERDYVKVIRIHWNQSSDHTDIQAAKDNRATILFLKILSPDAPDAEFFFALLRELMIL